MGLGESEGKNERQTLAGLDGDGKAIVGLRPSFSAQVRFGEPGAPVELFVSSPVAASSSGTTQRTNGGKNDSLFPWTRQFAGET